MALNGVFRRDWVNQRQHKSPPNPTPCEHHIKKHLNCRINYSKGKESLKIKTPGQRPGCKHYSVKHKDTKQDAEATKR